jgi:hypothetical protein
MRGLVACLLLFVSTSAFVPNFVSRGATRRSVNSLGSKKKHLVSDAIPGTIGNYQPSGVVADENAWDGSPSRVALISTLAASAFLSVPSPALAAGPDWGLFEGKTGSLLHPITMGGMFLFSLSTGWKGFQWRRQRTLGGEISELKKQIPKLEEGESPSAAALATQKQIDELTAERKELSGKNLKDSHFSSGVMLAAIGTTFAIEGPLNTYARAGKLFPGPHLYAGAGLVVLWSAAAACVPAMQKGSDTARSAHIALNSVGTGLFGWQVIR